MSHHLAEVRWSRTTPDFKYETYNREHTITFGGGTSLTASSAPEYLGDASLPNPEEALVGAISSCHMLTFLAVAAKKGFQVEDYFDRADGVMEKNSEGRIAVTRVTLRPVISFSDKQPTPEELARLHDMAHHGCFIANSVKTEITVDLS